MLLGPLLAVGLFLELRVARGTSGAHPTVLFVVSYFASPWKRHHPLRANPPPRAPVCALKNSVPPALHTHSVVSPSGLREGFSWKLLLCAPSVSAPSSVRFACWFSPVRGRSRSETGIREARPGCSCQGTRSLRLRAGWSRAVSCQCPQGAASALGAESVPRGGVSTLGAELTEGATYSRHALSSCSMPDPHPCTFSSTFSSKHTCSHLAALGDVNQTSAPPAPTCGAALSPWNPSPQSYLLSRSLSFCPFGSSVLFCFCI